MFEIFIVNAVVTILGLIALCFINRFGPTYFSSTNKVLLTIFVVGLIAGIVIIPLLALFFSWEYLSTTAFWNKVPFKKREK